jgi:hypothetical protein
VTDYNEFCASLFQPQLKKITLNGAEFDEAAFAQIHKFLETRLNKITNDALREIELKEGTLSGKILENLNEKKPLDEGISIADLVSIPANYYMAVSRLTAYSTSLMSQCRISEQDRIYALPVNIAAQKPAWEQFTYEYDFDGLVLKSFQNFHEKTRLGFHSYVASCSRKIISEQFEQMKKNLLEQKNVDREVDILQSTRFINYVQKQAAIYENLAHSILECFLERDETVVSIPAAYSAQKETAIHDLSALSPLPPGFVFINNEPFLRAMEQELASYTEFFVTTKKLTLEQEINKIISPQISNINEGRDLNSGINTADLSSWIKYYSDQASKTDFYVKLLEQFKFEEFSGPAVLPISYVSEPEGNPLDSFKRVINVSFPYMDAEAFNGLILDRDAAHMMRAGIDAVRAEWNRTNSEKKGNIMKNRAYQYQQNIGCHRNVNFGISGTELQESIAWEKRQQEISGYFFPSLIKSCILDDTPLEIAVLNPEVSALDISSLEIEGKIINDRVFDSDFIRGVERMAETLPQFMIVTFNVRIENTIRQEMDILRRNGVDWSRFRYELSTRLGLTLAELTETGKSLWAKLGSREYQKRNPETELFFHYMLRDFNLEEKLVNDLYWTQKTQEDFYNALIEDFINCSLGSDTNCLITGVVDMEKIANSNRMALEYITDVFPLLLNTEINIKFVEIDSMDELWGPVMMLEIGIGFIPVIGLAADIVIDICIDIFAGLVEKHLKQEEYAARIAEIVTTEERKFLQIINRYGGYK